MSSNHRSKQAYYSSKRSPLLLALAAGGLLYSPAFAQEQASDEYRAGYELVLEQNWAEAQRYFTDYQMRWPDSSWADDAAFWNCYSMDNGGADENLRFECYQGFIRDWPESSWVTDAASELAKLGSQMAKRGVSGPWLEFFNLGDIEFDQQTIELDAEEIQRTVERAMESAEQGLLLARQEIERMREQGLDIPPISEVPEINEQEIEIAIVEGLNQTRRVRVERGRRDYRRGGADDHLLSIVWALRDNEQATSILLNRLQSTDDPDLRKRIVLLLEDLPGDQITPALLDIIRNDNSEEVRNSAVYVLLDRGDVTARDDLLDLLLDTSTPLRLRMEIIDNMEDWDEGVVLGTLPEFLSDGTELSLLAEAADTLAGIDSPESIQILFDSFSMLQSPEAQITVVESIGDIETAETLSFLTDIALNAEQDLIAVEAIDSIANREDNFALSSLVHIFDTTAALDRRLAVIEGIGDIESRQAVAELDKILDDSSLNPELIAAGIYALGDTDRPEAVAIVAERYRASDDYQVRRAAIRALRDLEDFPGATETMLEILEQELQ